MIQRAERVRELRSRHSGLAASSECLSGRLGLLLGSAASRWDSSLALVVSSPYDSTCGLNRRSSCGLMSSWYAGVMVVTVGNHVCQCLVVLSDPLVGGWSCLVVSCPNVGMRVLVLVEV